MATETKTFYPSAYDDSDYNYKSIASTSGPVGKGSANSSSACTFYVQTGSNKEAYAFWKFDLSAIPEEATIDSVTGAANISASGVFSTSTVQLYSGSTAKGTAVAFRSGATSTTVYSLSPGSWTRAELQSCRIKIYAKRGTSYTSNNAYVSFWGADLTVTYTYQSEKFMLKLGGAWHDVSRVFKKVNGIWVEQTDLANVIEDGVRYQNGGEYVSPYKTITVTGSGDAIYNDQTYAVACLEINGEKISSAGSYRVEPGTVVDFWAAPFYYAYGTGTITLNGNSVGQSGDQNSVSYQHTVTDNLTVKLSVTGSSVASVGHIDITTGGGSSANLISFTIAGTSYQAEEGMTWAEWVASSYNTGGFKAGYVDWLGEDGVVTAEGRYAVMDNTETFVLATYLIVENHAYTTTEL